MHALPPHFKRAALLSTSIAAALSIAACGGNGTFSATSETSSALPKNVIIMINDGASAGTWEMSAYWQKGVRINEDRKSVV